MVLAQNIVEPNNSREFRVTARSAEVVEDAVLVNDVPQ